MERKIKNTILSNLTKNLKVLIVTKDIEIMKNFEHYFLDLYNDHIFLYNQKQIMEAIKKEPIDIIFVDMQVENLHPFKLIDDIREIVPLQIVVCISNNDDKELLYQAIRYKVDDFLLKPLTFIALKESTLRCLEHIVFTNEKKIKEYSTQFNSISPFKALEVLLKSQYTDIQLVGQYKDVPLIKSGKIIDVHDEELIVEIGNIEKHILEYSNHIIISSNYLSDDIYAVLKRIDVNKNHAVFDKLEFISSYVHHRKEIRVVPDDRFYLVIEFEKKKYNCKVVNISKSHVLVLLHKLPYSLSINSHVKMYFSLKSIGSSINSSLGQHSAVAKKCSVKEIYHINDAYKILLNFELNESNEKVLSDYIYERSFELIKEFKKGFKQK